MKAWMKVLMWAGLGAGIGFFAGYQIGHNSGVKETDSKWRDDLDHFWEDDEINEEGLDIDQHLNEYRGEEIAAEENVEPEEVSVEEAETEDFETDIPQLHPQDMVPEIITEEEAAKILSMYESIGVHYEQEDVIFYRGDEVFYNTKTQSIMPLDEAHTVFGHGIEFAFGGDPNNPVDIVWVRNETYATIFKIMEIDEAFCESVDGNCAPEEDEEDEEN
ncbi:MAG: hypothetical protein II545_06715 [Lachnospiraceae bacterium]|nr:hypothetical protein [Lachnospiraceae bacterium]